MADKTEKLPENVPGKFYVDSSCIICGACEAVSIKNFAVSADGSHDYVYKQPETEEELRSCQEALEGCPVGAIGDDGDE